MCFLTHKSHIEDCAIHMYIHIDNDLVLRLHFRTQILFGQRVSRVAEVLFKMVLVIHQTSSSSSCSLSLLSKHDNHDNEDDKDRKKTGLWQNQDQTSSSLSRSRSSLSKHGYHDDKDDLDPPIRNRQGLDKTKTKYWHLYHDPYHHYQNMIITMIRMI